MNEIGKLYENAGISKHRCYGCTGACTDCKPFYPPFTAEKQIELIKWLSKKGIYIAFVKEYNFSSCEDITGYGSEIFEYGLAGVINNLWQNLTKEEKEQVKGILNE